MPIRRAGKTLIVIGVIVLATLVTIQVVGIPVQNCTTTSALGSNLYTTCKVTTYHVTYSQTCSTISSGGSTSTVQCSTTEFG